MPFVGIGDSDAVALDKILAMNGVEAVEYNDALDGLGAEFQVRDELGGYTSYYYISDADDGTERYDLVGWADGDGYIVDEGVVPIASAFWLKSDKAGKLTFSL